MLRTVWVGSMALTVQCTASLLAIDLTPSCEHCCIGACDPIDSTVAAPAQLVATVRVGPGATVSLAGVLTGRVARIGPVEVRTSL